MSVVAHLEPKALWKHFAEICKIPHGSGNEKAVGEYVLKVAKELGIRGTRDEVGNVILYKDAAPGCEKSPTVILQGHLDMVNEKHSTSDHDFDNHPLKLILDGDWLRADGTTLGADNGIGVSAALAILEEQKLKHGPLEVVFTVDEERGLIGARSLTSDQLSGRILLNLDSEELGVFSIGCAGGADTHLPLPLKRTEAKGEKVLYLHLSGLRGGHSGIDIHEGRGNALKILNRLLWQLSQEMKIELVSLNGGDKHNAIPREAFAEIVLRKKDLPTAREWLGKAIEEIRLEFKPIENAIELATEELKGKMPKVLDKESKEKLMGLIFALPHGPLAMSRTMKGLVETSNNVAAIKMGAHKALILLSSRSSNAAALKATRNKLAAIAAMTGAKIEQPEGYPGWMPDVDSPLLKVASDTYKVVTGKKAQAMAIHAGLECGIIGEKFPGMDMISFGPDLKYPHSPEEKVNVKSVVKFYEHLYLMLETLA
jgi:dipeptidase D